VEQREKDHLKRYSRKCNINSKEELKKFDELKLLPRNRSTENNNDNKISFKNEL